ncbi:MAG: ExbD/TolR family protein [Phycisphaerales bacterium]
MAKKKRDSGPIELQLTSMMDVVFQLIIFFILVNNFVSQDLPDMEPPEPKHSRAVLLENASVRVVNVLPDAAKPGFADYIQYASTKLTLQRSNVLTEMLVDEKRKIPSLEVSLRVDKSVRFDQVQPVMQAITNAGIARINLVALIEPNVPGAE